MMKNATQLGDKTLTEMTKSAEVNSKLRAELGFHHRGSGKLLRD